MFDGLRNNVMPAQCPGCGEWHHGYTISSHMTLCLGSLGRINNLDIFRAAELSEPHDPFIRAALESIHWE